MNGPKLAQGWILILANIVVIVLFLYFDSGTKECETAAFPLAWFVIGAAFFGSITNQPFRTKDKSLSSFVDRVAYVLWKANIAIVFAFVLLVMFMGGLLEGSLFPQFTNRGESFKNMECFLTRVDPLLHEDAAKLLFWSFVAGFSEGLVPNLISKLAGEGTPNGEKGASKGGGEQ